MHTDTTKKQQQWLLPSGEKNKMTAGLYLVATPIGNLRDISLRALDILATADCVACEDTRVTGKLLSYYGLSQKLLPYNDHNADKQRPALLEKIKAGQVVVLVSDAGTPLISDPGYKLVRDCVDQALYVTGVPGANAPLTAVQLSALPSNAFSFAGFLPAKKEARDNALSAWKDTPGLLVLFESAPRLLKTLQAILEKLGDRPVAVVREMTKLYEEARHGTASDLIRFYEENGAPKGEIVLVVAPAQERKSGEEDRADIETTMRELIAGGMKTKAVAKFVSARTGVSKKDAYALAIEIAETQQ